MEMPAAVNGNKIFSETNVLNSVKQNFGNYYESKD